MLENTLTIALAKGRLGDRAGRLLEQAGYDCSVLETETRKLILENPEQNLRFILAKPTDVPTYVGYGVADLGVVGKDTLMEAGMDLYEVLDLNYGHCRMCVAGPAEQKSTWGALPHKRVATKYPNIADHYFSENRHESVEIIKLNGSIELAPLIGLSDVIIDIVESGKTLKANHLAIFEDIADISARMVVNRVSMKMKKELITPLIANVRTVLAAGTEDTRG